MWLGKKYDEISVSGKIVLVLVGLKVKVNPKLPSYPTTLPWEPTGLNRTTDFNTLTLLLSMLKSYPLSLS
jgi:hypothetical protein